MKHIVRKLYWDYEKEEQWINEMCAKGLILQDYSWARYVFEEGTAGEYIYRIELLKNNARHPESTAYIRFMEENGVEHVASYFRWMYFRKKADQGEFEIYTDNESRLKNYKSVNRFWITLVVLNLLAGLNNLSIATTNIIKYSRNIFNINTFCFMLSIAMSIFLLAISNPMRKKIRKLKKEIEVHQ